MGYTFTDRDGSFRLEHPERTSALYFPLAGEDGLMSAVSPNLGGDCKREQGTFLLQPVSVEDLHNNRSARGFWVCSETGAWSATGGSAESEALRGTPQEEETLMEAGLMWCRFQRRSSVHSLASAVTLFIPTAPQAPELMLVSITNTGDWARTITPIAAIPLYGRGADRLRDHRHVTSLLHRIATVPAGVEVTPTLRFDEGGHRANTDTYFVYGISADGALPEAFCPAAADFLGEGGSYARPAGAYAPDTVSWVGVGASFAGCEAVGALRFPGKTLAPGESAAWTVALGVTDHTKPNPWTGERFVSQYGGKLAQEALERTRETWNGRVNIRFDTGSRERDMQLIWTAFQPMLRRIFGCSFLPYHDYGRGGRGWRDLWQDCHAILLMGPNGTREKLVQYCAGIRLDGTNATIIGSQPGEFVADRNGIQRVWMDHGFWPLQTVLLYLHQTGDLTILLEEVPYFKDRQILRGDGVDDQWQESQGVRQRDSQGREVLGSVLEHMLLETVSSYYDVGEHNHIRLRTADWNDALDMAPHRGESVAFTHAYAGNLLALAELMEKLSVTHPRLPFQRELLPLLRAPSPETDSVSAKQALLRAYCQATAHTVSGERETVELHALAQTLKAMGKGLQAHLRATEWLDTPAGGFFNGYYDDSAARLEGVVGDQVRMGLTGQVFAVMFGTARDEDVAAIAASADKLLYQEDIGGYRLNTDYGAVSAMGRAFSFAYGHKENGAVFCHMAVMYANALYRRGFVREGWKVLQALFRQMGDFPRSRCLPGIPEYFSGTGRGMYPYLTGSASWLLLTFVTQIFGVRGRYGDLEIAPALVRELLDENREAAVSLPFAGASLEVRYRAREEQDVYTAVRGITLDGVPIAGNKISREVLLAKSGLREIVVEL